jgi:hypothetical protein
LVVVLEAASLMAEVIVVAATLEVLAEAVLEVVALVAIGNNNIKSSKKEE